MTTKDLKQQYLKETGISCMNPNNEAGSNFYTDDYTQWLEQKLLLNKHNKPVVNESIRLDQPI